MWLTSKITCLMATAASASAHFSSLPPWTTTLLRSSPCWPGAPLLLLTSKPCQTFCVIRRVSDKSHIKLQNTQEFQTTQICSNNPFDNDNGFILSAALKIQTIVSDSRLFLNPPCPTYMTKCVFHHSAPWFTTELRKMKGACRQLERLRRKLP